ncbi:MAG: helix-turn-helix domain-containing protein [Bacteroidota bacterium]
MEPQTDSFVNHQLKLATDYVEYTDRNIFLTGKAGTGKTTFLHNLRKSSPKRMAVVAPTGVAAINAGGVTIHSFFQLAFGPYVPEHLLPGKLNFNPGARQERTQKKFNREKIQLIQSLDLLVIDEISMVRADVLDAIDEVLRRYRQHHKPFGGVQLLMIGDLHQLSPVIKDDEWKLLADHYETGYFFSSLALQQSTPVCIELKHIYRQSDEYFIKILNSIRDNNIDHHLLKELNERYLPDFKPADDDGYITLTTHNNSAQQINSKKLQELTNTSYMFNADIKNEFPPYAYPTEQQLELKVNAQVMFVKNDSSKDKLYFNGKIGRITNISEGVVYVKCESDYMEIAVRQEEWKNIRYALNSTSKEIDEEVIGTFKQYPLKLAWAITIHKSQGLTFEKAIIDANAAFAHGQVYVALSRCKTFEGMVLSSPIGLQSIRTDRKVAEFSNNMERNLPDDAALIESKIMYQQLLLQELLDFTGLLKEVQYVKKLVQENGKAFLQTLLDGVNQLHEVVANEIVAVNDKFRYQIGELLKQNSLPEDNAGLQQRIMKAAGYYAELMDTKLYEPSKLLVIDTDNKLLKETATSAVEDMQRAMFVKIACLKEVIKGFAANNYLRVRANADIDFKPIIKSRATGGEFGVRSMKHAALYSTIKTWRDEKADEANQPAYMVLPQKVLMEIIKQLPVTVTELEAIKGLGKKKISAFGSLLVEMVRRYCADNGIEKVVQESLAPVAPAPAPPKKEKAPGTSQRISLEMFKEGKDIATIAAERGFASTTIEGHLATFILKGELALNAVVNDTQVTTITQVLLANQDKPLSEIKVGLGDDISYGMLRMVKNHLIFTGQMVGEKGDSTIVEKDH